MAFPAGAAVRQRRPNRGERSPAVFPASHNRMMPEKRSKRNPDPSRERGDGGKALQRAEAREKLKKKARGIKVPAMSSVNPTNSRVLATVQ